MTKTEGRRNYRYDREGEVGAMGEGKNIQVGKKKWC